MAVVTAFLFGILIGLALRPLVNAYVVSRLAARFERDEPHLDESHHALRDRTLR